MIREVDTGSKRELKFEYIRDGASVGFILLVKKDRARRVLWVVESIRVDPSLQRKGIGTKLYERAAREACARRLPLASEERIGEMSTPFWEKQMRKGRAMQLCKKCGPRGQAVYALPCPAPKSLKGLFR